MRTTAVILNLLLLASLGAYAKSSHLDLSALDGSISVAIEKKFPDLGKKELTRAELDEVIKWLVLEQNFDSATVEFDEKTLNYTIRTGRTHRVHTVTIAGNHTLGEGDLRRPLAVTEGSPFDKDTILQGAEKVRLYYKDSGFFDTSIKVDLIPLKQGDFDVVLMITEGPQTKLTEFHLTCANPKLKKNLQKKMDRFVGDPYTPANVNLIAKEIRTYLAENQYLRADLSEPVVTVSGDGRGVTIDFKIEHAEDYVFETTGQVNITYSSLKDAIGFDDYTSTTPNIAAEIAQKARQHYLAQGYARVEIKASEEDGYSSNQRKVLLAISEGPKVKISKIEFNGRISKLSDFYANLLLEQSTAVFADGIYVKDDLDTALKNLVIDRRNNGYFRAKIISARTTFNEDHDRVSLFINLDEGPLTQVQRITFEGVAESEEPTLLKQLGLKQLDPLRLNQLETGLAKIKTYYQDHGYLEMTIANEQNENGDLVTYNEDNTLANLNIRIVEGAKVMVDSIVIQGNTITKDYVVLKELEFNIGDVLTPANINESKARLERLGIFSGIEIRTLEEHTMVSKRTVLVNVIDRDPGIFNLGVGATNERKLTARGFTGIAYRNIGGTARVASGRIDFNYLTDILFVEKKLAIGYVEPYLFNSRTKGRATFTDATFVSNFNSLAASDVIQASLGLEQEITSHFFGSWDLVNFSKYHDFSAVNDPAYVVANTNIASTGPTIELDYRDHPFNPTKGTLTHVAAELGTPELGSSSFIRYWRATASFSGFIPLSKNNKVVWATNVRGGYLKNLMDPNLGGYVPFDKKGFLLGGETTIRGFTNTEAFPNSNDLNSASYPMRNEANMYLIKTELRFPIKGNFGGAIFYDGGAVTLTEFNLPFYYRDASGIALRYNTPVGPVTIDIGWKTHPLAYRGENPYAVHLAIGSF